MKSNSWLDFSQEASSTFNHYFEEATSAALHITFPGPLNTTISVSCPELNLTHHGDYVVKTMREEDTKVIMQPVKEEEDEKNDKKSTKEKSVADIHRGEDDEIRSEGVDVVDCKQMGLLNYLNGNYHLYQDTQTHTQRKEEECKLGEAPCRQDLYVEAQEEEEEEDMDDSLGELGSLMFLIEPYGGEEDQPDGLNINDYVAIHIEDVGQEEEEQAVNSAEEATEDIKVEEEEEEEEQDLEIVEEAVEDVGDNEECYVLSVDEPSLLLVNNEEQPCASETKDELRCQEGEEEEDKVCHVS